MRRGSKNGQEIVMNAPKYVIPTRKFGFVVYEDKQAIGFQFATPSGDETFVPIAGAAARGLISDMEELLELFPEAEHWKPPTVPGAKVQ